MTAFRSRFSSRISSARSRPKFTPLLTIDLTSPHSLRYSNRALPIGFIGAGKLAGSVIRGLLLRKVLLARKKSSPASRTMNCARACSARPASA